MVKVPGVETPVHYLLYAALYLSTKGCTLGWLGGQRHSGWTWSLGSTPEYTSIISLLKEKPVVISSVKLSSTLAWGEEEEANIAVHRGSKQMAAIDCFVRNGTLSHLLNFPVDSRFDKTLS